MNGAPEHVHDLVAAYVLGAVTPLEAALVEEHLAARGACRQVEAELRAVEALLPTLAGELAPPPALKAPLLALVEEGPPVVAESTIGR
jgi:anti-sigma factor RsiW